MQRADLGSPYPTCPPPSGRRNSAGMRASYLCALKDNEREENNARWARRLGLHLPGSRGREGQQQPRSLMPGGPSG